MIDQQIRMLFGIEYPASAQGVYCKNIISFIIHYNA